MNTLLWIAQILLAGFFLFAGLTKLFAYEKLTRRVESFPGRGTVTVTRGQAVPVGLLEIAGAIGVIMPPILTPEVLSPDYLLVRLAATGLALLMVGASIYHMARRESAAPSVTLFLLALFILVGRWPH